MDGLIRSDGVQGWIESLGQRSADVVAALRDLDADVHALIIEEALRLFPTSGLGDPNERLAAMNNWSGENPDRWSELERARVPNLDPF
jgi:hypothetical protein